MEAVMKIQQVDKVEVTTLQDNYVDLLLRDNSAVISRAILLKDNELKNSILGEHGFSALVTVTAGASVRSILFDFGFSAHGAAFNAKALNLDLSAVEAAVLSHGHLDHVGGMAELSALVGKKGVPLVLHPEAFRSPRYIKFSEEFKVTFPPLTRQQVTDAGLSAIETAKPHGLLDDAILFLGEIPRKTDFETGVPNFFYQKDGQETWDDLADDSAIVMNVRDKGLVVISGCAHSGIVNTVAYARQATGVDPVLAVMGGFHLSGPGMEPIVDKTTQGLKQFSPTYVIPTHCTGRYAGGVIEHEMPGSFILNTSGTKLTFS
jgi:7,8-dihydropterin-6-yl-methyl-4-(beta-D-ribofuranosyl)aminobenzene 5'-phosphate synthase